MELLFWPSKEKLQQEIDSLNLKISDNFNFFQESLNHLNEKLKKTDEKNRDELSLIKKQIQELEESHRLYVEFKKTDLPRNTNQKINSLLKKIRDNFKKDNTNKENIETLNKFFEEAKRKVEDNNWFMELFSHSIRDHIDDNIDFSFYPDSIWETNEQKIFLNAFTIEYINILEKIKAPLWKINKDSKKWLLVGKKEIFTILITIFSQEKSLEKLGTIWFTLNDWQYNDIYEIENVSRTRFKKVKKDVLEDEEETQISQKNEKELRKNNNRVMELFSHSIRDHIEDNVDFSLYPDSIIETKKQKRFLDYFTDEYIKFLEATGKSKFLQKIDKNNKSRLLIWPDEILNISERFFRYPENKDVNLWDINFYIIDKTDSWEYKDKYKLKNVSFERFWASLQNLSNYFIENLREKVWKTSEKEKAINENKEVMISNLLNFLNLIKDIESNDNPKAENYEWSSAEGLYQYLTENGNLKDKKRYLSSFEKATHRVLNHKEREIWRYLWNFFDLFLEKENWQYKKSYSQIKSISTKEGEINFSPLNMNRNEQIAFFLLEISWYEKHYLEKWKDWKLIKWKERPEPKIIWNILLGDEKSIWEFYSKIHHTNPDEKTIQRYNERKKKYTFTKVEL